MDVTIALQRAVQGFAHGSAALAARLGMSVTTLNHKVSPTYPGAHCSPEECVAIQQITGDHAAHHAAGALLGYVHIPVPQLGEGEADESVQALARCVHEFGQFAAEAAQDLMDGRVSDNELARIEREGAEALAAIHALMKRAQGLNLAGKPVGLRAVLGGR